MRLRFPLYLLIVLQVGTSGWLRGDTDGAFPTGISARKPDGADG